MDAPTRHAFSVSSKRKKKNTRTRAQSRVFRPETQVDYVLVKWTSLDDVDLDCCQLQTGARSALKHFRIDSFPLSIHFSPIWSTRCRFGSRVDVDGCSLGSSFELPPFNERFSRWTLWLVSIGFTRFDSLPSLNADISYRCTRELIEVGRFSVRTNGRVRHSLRFFAHFVTSSIHATFVRVSYETFRNFIKNSTRNDCYDRCWPIWQWRTY